MKPFSIFPVAACLVASLAAFGCGGEALSIDGYDAGGGIGGCTPSGALSYLTVTPGDISLSPGAKRSLTVKGVYANGCAVDATNAVYLNVDDGSVASIGRDELFDGGKTRYVEGKAVGSTTLVASTEKDGGGVASDPVSITVGECGTDEGGVSSLEILPAAIEVEVGDAKPFHVYATWKSGCVFDATSRVYYTVGRDSVATVEKSASGGREVRGGTIGITSVVASLKAGGEGIRSQEMKVMVVDAGTVVETDGGVGPEDPVDAGPQEPADAGHQEPADAGHEEPVDAGPEEPEDAGEPVVTLKSLKIYPTDLTLSPVDRMPITVTATWSDGTTRDVTDDASFSTSAAGVAKVVSVGTLAVDKAKTFLEAVSIGNATITASWSDGTKTVTGTGTAKVVKRATETRALWVSRWNLGSTESAIRTNIQKFAKAGFNAILFQVMGDGTAYYNSSILPVKSSSLDCLAVAIDEAHKQGIQLHAYINALVAPKTVPTSGKHILVSHPEYICKDKSGNQVSDDGYTWVAAEDGYIDYYKTVVKEILDKYDVDGIHVDRIRSPTKTTCHSANLNAQFKKAYPSCSGGASDGTECDKNWQKFYTAQVTKLAQAIYQTVVSNKPAVMVSFAVWGIYTKLTDIPGVSCTTSQGVDYNQDSVGWMEIGIADAICPMSYWGLGDGAYKGCTDWGRLTDFFLARSHGRQVIMGMHAQDSSAVNMTKITSRITYAREHNLPGTAIFASNYFSDANFNSFASGAYAADADPTPIVHR